MAEIALEIARNLQLAPADAPSRRLSMWDATTQRWILARCDVAGNLLVNAIFAPGAVVDVSNRWPRELGQVDLARYLGVACGPANPLDTRIIVAGAAIDPRQIRNLVAADVVTVNNLLNPHPVTPGAGTVWDVDLAQVLGAALNAGNPVIAGIYDAAGNRMPAMDASARKGYVNVEQSTRTSLKTQPEREDLLDGSQDVAAVGAGDTVLLAGVGGQKHKIYDCGYETDAAVRVGFRFGAGNVWCRRITAGPYAQSFTHPHVSAVNTALNFNVTGAVNAYVWWHYVTEA
jgi:hypothetical protein